MHITDRIVAVLVLGTLTTGLYAGSFIDWDSEDAQQNPLAFLNQKETIRIWYGGRGSDGLYQQRRRSFRGGP